MDGGGGSQRDGTPLDELEENGDWTLERYAYEQKLEDGGRSLVGAGSRQCTPVCCSGGT